MEPKRSILMGDPFLQKGRHRGARVDPIPGGLPDIQNWLPRVPGGCDILREGCRAFPEVPPSATPRASGQHPVVCLLSAFLAFVLPFNSLHWLERKHQPSAEVASLGCHPMIQRPGCLEMGADAAKCGHGFSTSLL